MKIVVSTFFTLIALLFLFYLYTPNQDFPAQLDDFLRSSEPADIESSDRRGYFTQHSRDEVISHYKNAYSYKLFGLRITPIRLNYPPEDSQTLIRDQTRSTYLEELVFPMRESILINGFEPKEDKDAIVVGGKSFRQKIIVKHVKSSPAVRVLVGSLSLVFIYFFSKFIIKEFKNK